MERVRVNAEWRLIDTQVSTDNGIILLVASLSPNSWSLVALRICVRILIEQELCPCYPGVAWVALFDAPIIARKWCILIPSRPANQKGNLFVPGFSRGTSQKQLLVLGGNRLTDARQPARRIA